LLKTHRVVAKAALPDSAAEEDNVAVERLQHRRDPLHIGRMAV
jgi:hypothetical protein